MSLWGSNTKDESKPKWMSQAEKDELFATDSGWVRKIPGAGTYADAQLSIDSQPNDADTVTVGSKTYTFKTSLTPTANEVLIGASALTAATNLVHAINLTGTSGTDYASATTINLQARANILVGGSIVKLKAKVVGTAGNALTLTESTSNARMSIPFGFSGGTDSLETVVAIGNLKSSLTGIQSITVDAAGSNYVDGDVVTVKGIKEDCIGEILETGGAIDSVTILKPGAGFNHGLVYDEANGKITVSSAAGTGAQLTAVLEGPQITSLEINDPNGDKTFTNGGSDKIQLTVRYNEEVDWSDGGADPLVDLSLAGNDAAQLKNCVLISPVAGQASHEHVYSYTVEAAGAKGTCQLLATDQPTNGQTVILGSRTYTYVTSLTPTANEVLIGTDFDDSIQNLVYAITNDQGTSGVKYAGNTPLQDQYTAIVNGSDPSQADITAIKPGTASNSFTAGGTYPGGANASYANDWATNATGTNGASARASAKAVSHLTMITKPTANDTVVVGSVTYTFKATVDTTANEVLIGDTVADSRANLIAAINVTPFQTTPESGVIYGSATVQNPDVSAVAGTVPVIICTARVKGTAGNSLASTETLTADTDVWTNTTFDLGRAGELTINGTQITVGGGTLSALESSWRTGVTGVAATAGAISNIDFSNDAGLPSSITISGTTWSADVIKGAYITVASAENPENNGTYKILNVVSTTKVNVHYVYSWAVDNATDTSATLVVDRFAIGPDGVDSAVAADISLTSAGSVGVKSSGTLTIGAAVPTENDTVTIGHLVGSQLASPPTTVYTWKDTLTGAAYEVLIDTTGVDTAAKIKNCATNLKHAINVDIDASAHEGITFGLGTKPHPDVTATSTATTVVLSAKVPGAEGNVITTVESGTNTSFGAATLENGADTSVDLKAGLDLSDYSVN